MKKEVPILVVSTDYLNQMAALPATIIFISDEGGEYLIVANQEVQDTADDDAHGYLSYDDQFSAYTVDLGGTPGVTSPQTIRVKPGGQLSLHIDADLLSGHSFNFFIRVIEL